jgi:hypothetical protein
MPGKDAGFIKVFFELEFKILVPLSGFDSRVSVRSRYYTRKLVTRQFEFGGRGAVAVLKTKWTGCTLKRARA